MKKILAVLVLCIWSLGVYRMMGYKAETVPVFEEVDTAYIGVDMRVAAPTPPPAPVIVPYEETEEDEALLCQNTLPSRNVAARDYDRKDLTLLATLIYGEAGDECYDGKLAVGTVVMNRLKTGYWGKTLHSVIYAPGQFDAVQCNWHKPDKDSIRAAQQVLEGYRSFEDNIIYYFNPVMSTDLEFCESVDVVYVIEDHVFGR